MGSPPAMDDPPAPAPDAPPTIYPLSDLDQGGHNRTVRAFIFYSLPSTLSAAALTSSLTAGLQNTIAHLPFLAGTFERSENNRLHITTSPTRLSLPLHTHDFPASTLPPLSALAAQRFTLSALPLTSYLPADPPPSTEVCALQATFIPGGLVLAVRISHAAADFTSLNTFLTLLCASTRAAAERRPMPTHTPDLDRTPYNAPLDPPPREALLAALPLFHVISKPPLSSSGDAPPTPAAPRPRMQTHLYTLRQHTLTALKARVAPHLPPSTPFVSSYDLLAALLWAGITRARLSVHPDRRTAPTRLVHPVDVRRRGGRTAYFGNAVVGAQAGPAEAAWVASALDADPDDGGVHLARLAALVRASTAATDARIAQALAALLAGLDEGETYAPRADFAETDLFVNSWAAGDYELGGGARAVALRPGGLGGGGASVLVLRGRGEEGGEGGERSWEVLVQLEEVEHEALRTDGVFMGWFGGREGLGWGGG